MFDRLIEAARGQGIRALNGVYRPTAKNKMVAGLYEQFGFRRLAETADEIRYELTVPAERVLTATEVQNVSRVPARVLETAAQ